MLGDEGFARLSSSTVVVIGLGGVGSHAAVALARSGVGRVRLVDFDEVTETSLNRHACALPRHVGMSKADVTAEHLREIHPGIAAEPVKAFFHDDTADEILGGSPDYVVDAIDSLNPKVALIRTCVERGLPIASSMGASARTDPSKVRVAPIEESHGCPLAKLVRKRLRRQGIERGAQVVFSCEEPIAPLPPDENEEWYGRGRKRNRLPSMAVMPAIFGLSLAGIVIKELGGARLKSHQRDEADREGV